MTVDQNIIIEKIAQARAADASGQSLDVLEILNDMEQLCHAVARLKTEVRTVCVANERNHADANELKNAVLKTGAETARANGLKKALEDSTRLYLALKTAYETNAQSLNDAKQMLAKTMPTAMPAHAKTIKSQTAQITNAMRALSFAGSQEVGGHVETRISQRIATLAEQLKTANQLNSQHGATLAQLTGELSAAKEIIAETHNVLDKANIKRSASGKLSERVAAMCVSQFANMTYPEQLQHALFEMFKAPISTTNTPT